ncbi:hypothetical protein [Pedobacter ginsengisoli]|uniref:hypothetical protein n=1 Tax=Pedobacter ginsengisoli TaxID=363852 RepID=UPI00254F9999|nr:hypothetical protein [Pedobacter ginsengisoli]
MTSYVNEMSPGQTATKCSNNEQDKQTLKDALLILQSKRFNTIFCGWERPPAGFLRLNSLLSAVRGTFCRRRYAEVPQELWKGG